jgi:uncharacterized membrane protein YdbT with pleckstrin-like domain
MLVRDAVELAELQLQLFAADGREMARKSAPPLLTVVAGVTVAMSGLPLLLVGLAYALVELAGFPVWLAMLSSAVAGIAIGATAVLVGIRWLRPQLSIWQRSAAELKENVYFLMGSLSRSTPDDRESDDSSPA